MSLVQFIIPILLFAVAYFLLIRPQQKRAKQHREMVSQITSGQHVTTIGGIKGTVRSVDETTVVLNLNNNGTQITLEKAAIKQVDPS